MWLYFSHTKAVYNDAVPQQQHLTFSFLFFTLFILYWGMVGGGLITELCQTLVTSWTVIPPGSSVHQISQARILEWGAISFSRGSSRPRDRTRVSCIADALPFEPPGKPILLTFGAISFWTFFSVHNEVSFSAFVPQCCSVISFCHLLPHQRLISCP